MSPQKQTQGGSLPSPFVSFCLSLSLYLLVYCFLQSSLYTLSPFNLLTSTPSSCLPYPRGSIPNLPLCYLQSYQGVINIVCITWFLVSSAKNRLSKWHIAEDKTLCLDFVLDVVYFSSFSLLLNFLSCQCLRLLSSVVCMHHNTRRSQLQLIAYNPEIQSVTRRSPPPVRSQPPIPEQD